MKEKLIGKDWNITHRGTKVFIKKDLVYSGMNHVKGILKAGTYYISGFWIDLVGLCTTREKAYNQTSDVFLQSEELKKFWRVIT